MSTAVLGIPMGGASFGILSAIVAVSTALVIKILILRVLAPTAHSAMTPTRGK